LLRVPPPAPVIMLPVAHPGPGLLVTTRFTASTLACHTST